MNHWNNLSIRIKLSLLTGLAGAGLIVFAAISFLTLSEVEVGSKISQTAHLIGNVAADFENPPMSPLNAFPPAVRAQDCTSAADVDQLASRVHEMRLGYEKGYEQYMAEVPAGPVRDTIEQGRGDAEVWFDLAEQRYFPLLKNGKKEEAIELWRTQMEPAFKRNSASIDHLAILLNEWSDKNDQLSTAKVKTGTFWMIAAGLGALTLILVVGLAIGHGISAGVRKTKDLLESLANCDLTVEVTAGSTDEIGQMQRAVRETVESFRTVISAINSTAKQVATASVEMKAETQETAKRIHESAMTSQQAAEAMVQMQSAVKEVSTDAQASARAANQAESAAAQGNSVVMEALDSVQGIANATSAVAGRILELGKSSGEIGRIVSTINEIAEQTNLLALNAAIEAARAGEHGRGFSVVAGEVRRLAERTTLATKEIEQMVGSIQRETTETVSAMQVGSSQVEQGLKKTAAMSDALKSIQQFAKDTGAQIEHIASSSTQQAASVEDITGNLKQISAFVQQASSSAGQTAQSCEQLSALAAEMRMQSERFRMPAASA